MIQFLEFFKGTSILLLILIFFTFFSYYMPKGKKAMSGLSSAVCATFLIEVFNKWVLGNIPYIGNFTKSIGEFAGYMAAPACCILVIILMGGKPIYAVLSGSAIYAIGFSENSELIVKQILQNKTLNLKHFSIIAGLAAGYIMYFVYELILKYSMEGLDLLFALLFCVPLTALISLGSDKAIAPILSQLGEIIELSQNMTPIPMSIIVGGFLTVVGTSPLSSMALAVAIGLRGSSMAVGSITAFGSVFMNGTLFHKMKYGTKKETISVAIEPLSQSDIISMNPISVYVTNFIGAAFTGMIVVIYGVYILGIEQTIKGIKDPVFGFTQEGVGLATPFGPVAMFGQKGANVGYFLELSILLFVVAITNFIFGWLGGLFFKNSKRVTIFEILEKPIPLSHQYLLNEIDFYQANKRRLPMILIINLQINKLFLFLEKQKILLQILVFKFIYKWKSIIKKSKNFDKEDMIKRIQILNQLNQNVKNKEVHIETKIKKIKLKVLENKTKRKNIQNKKDVNLKIKKIKQQYKQDLINLNFQFKNIKNDIDKKHKYNISKIKLYFDYQDKIDNLKPMLRIKI